jgi:hypothetical protein
LIRLNKDDKTEFRRLFVEAIALQVKLYDKLSEIESITGMVNGLDEAVRGEASNYTDPPAIEQFPIKDANFILAGLEREK